MRVLRHVMWAVSALMIWVGCSSGGDKGNVETASEADAVGDLAQPVDLSREPEVSELVGAEQVDAFETSLDLTPAPDPFKIEGAWSAYDAGGVGGLKTEGYFGMIWDGRYAYHAPCRDTAGFHARALRYDSKGEFKDSGSWEAYDAAGTDGLTAVGYGGGASDGRYVYYAPFTNESSRHAEVLRYDSQGGFAEAASWAAHDAGLVDGLKMMGYVDAVFDGRFVYFSPFGYDPFAHARVLRYDTQGDFKSAESWSAYDAGTTSGMNTRGYYGLVMEGDFVYFVPFHDGTEFHGRVLRYNTTGDFDSESSWSAYDAAQTGGLDNRGYKMAASDGRYVYFVPFRTSTSETHGRVLRLDSQGEFADAASWSAYDAGATEGLNSQAYVGAVCAGDHVYFCPYSYGAVSYHSVMLRLNTTSPFAEAQSWQAFDAHAIDGLDTKGYKGIVFDGRYVHFTPYHNGTALRFDTQHTP